MKFALLTFLSIAVASVAAFSVDRSSQQARRDFLAQSTAAVAALNTLAILPLSANAVSGLPKVNAKLQGFGLPPATPVPDGFAPLLDIYGRGKNRTPLLVTFNHPLNWVVTLPSNNANGEGGTIQAGDYGKGDTATLYVYSDQGNVGDISKASKELVETVLKRSIGQRGDNMYQNFKITKLEPGTDSYLKGQNYVLADFKYQLLTGAGFEVDRKGVASLTSEGGAIEALWAASTSVRYKKTEPALRDIVKSFRCYAEGINFADDLYVVDE